MVMYGEYKDAAASMEKISCIQLSKTTNYPMFSFKYFLQLLLKQQNMNCLI